MLLCNTVKVEVACKHGSMILTPPQPNLGHKGGVHKPSLRLMSVWATDYCNVCLCCSPARSERYSHLGSDDDDETCDEDTSLELKQFSSVAHRFSKVVYDPMFVHIA